MKVEMGFFKCMESMARDMRHPYIPSTTVLDDTAFLGSISRGLSVRARPEHRTAIYLSVDSSGWCEDRRRRTAVKQ